MSRICLTARPVIALCLLLELSALAMGQTPRVFHVAVNGSDTSIGSVAAPLASLKHAVSIIAPGDTIYVRGGTFESGTTIRVDVSGTDTARVNILAFPGESPVFDFSGNDREGLDVRGSFVHIKGLTIEYAGRSGVFVKGGTDNIVENVVTRFNRNSGLQVEDGASNTLILNTDSYGNYDPANNGENADGFAIKFDVGSGNRLLHCRAWGNSDDGFDFWEAGEGVTVEGSWAFRNGINVWEDPNFQGDSNGFKLGHGAGGHRLVRNLAWGHLKHGFDVNGNVTGVTLYNNSAFENADRNFYFDEDNAAHVLRNNISLSSRVLMFDAVDDVSNSWNGFNVGGVDFLSLNDAGADGPRQPDGSLPVLDFMRLAGSSELVDAGVDVGIPFEGAAPDLGAFETSAAGVSSERERPRQHSLTFTSYPNPFTRATNLLIDAPSPSSLRVEIFDVNGRKVTTLHQEASAAGRTVLTWQPLPYGVSGGIYFARLESGASHVVVPLVFRPLR